uniref:Gamma-glutamyltranspeptidase 1 n=1 Tax=Ascaris lumbricoides TaxID=6252 RepID=A0A0M3HSL5_ASCLU
MRSELGDMDFVKDAIEIASFGARVASESTGIVWNCQMDDFSLPDRPNFYGYPPAPANFIRPGKRPMSSISPLIFVNRTSNKVELAIGSAGGSTIITTVSTVAARVLKLGWDLKTALDAPRLHDQLLPNVTHYEPNFPQEYVAKLAKRGHIMEKTPAIGGATAIHVKESRLFATSDFRKGAESQPAGY